MGMMLWCFGGVAGEEFVEFELVWTVWCVDDCVLWWCMIGGYVDFWFWWFLVLVIFGSHWRYWMVVFGGHWRY